MPSSGVALLKETLLSTHLVTEQQWNYAVKTAQLRGVSLEKVFLEMGVVEAEKISHMAEILYGVPKVSIDDYVVEPELLKLVPRETAERYHAIPLYASGANRLTVAMVDPLDVDAVDALSYIVQKDLRVVWISEDDFARAVKLYDGDPSAGSLRKILDDFQGDGQLAVPQDEGAREDSERLLRMMAEEAPVVRLSAVLFTQAVQWRASDIHLEPGKTEARARIRVDGLLQDLMTLPMAIYTALISRLKLTGNMDITERRLPQDGRCEFQVEGRTVDLRLASAPCLYGEKMVIRLSDSEAVLPKLSQLGYSPRNLERFEGLLSRPYGMILVTGPTGSGKATTLYGALSILNSPEKNIQTIEDPIERKVDRVNQLQVQSRIGLTFARALRAFLRQDPDVVMLGEIRDAETAEIAIQAALTGHLVLSTLHTNDAIGAITRLVDMGVPAYMVAAALRGVLAQRLVRKLCQVCREQAPIRDDEVKAILDQPAIISEVFRAAGCGACGGSGYSGRTVISEVMVMSPEIARAAVAGADSHALLAKAREGGYTTMRDDAMQKVAEGQTSMDEVLRMTMSLDL